MRKIPFLIFLIILAACLLNQNVFAQKKENTKTLNFSLCADYSNNSNNPFTPPSLLFSSQNFSALFKLEIPQYELSPAQDTAEITRYKEKKNYWLPALETAGINMVIWAYNYFYLEYGWSRVSLKSIINNMKKGYIWDDNSFQSNQFGHPLHGGIQYSAARANGLNFWEAMPYPFFGSMMWEFFLETGRPSTNDSIMTTLGGIALGEILFRIAGLIVDESSTGIERVIREVSVFLINPGVSADRLIKGKMWRQGRGRQERIFGRSYKLNVPLGFSSTNLTRKATFALDLDLEYMQAFEKSKIKPYDYFTLNISLGKNGRNKGFLNQEFFSKGLIFGRKIDFPFANKALAGVFAGFDYIDTDFIGKMSSVDLGYGLVSSFDFGSSFFLDYSQILSVVIFGGTSSLVEETYGGGLFVKNNEEFNFGKGPESYYMGPGFTGKISVEIGKKGLGSFFFAAAGYWIKGVLLTKASENLNKFSLGFKIDLPGNTQLLFEYSTYMRNGDYQNLTLYKTKHVSRLMYVLNF